MYMKHTLSLKIETAICIYMNHTLYIAMTSTTNNSLKNAQQTHTTSNCG